MFALLLFSIAATLMYLINQNQQILAKPISSLLGGSCAVIAVSFGLLSLYQQEQLIVALLKCIAMVSVTFMVLPVVGGFYANNRSNRSMLLKNNIVAGE